MKHHSITRLLAIVLCIAMLATVTPVISLAETTTFDKVEYELNPYYGMSYYVVDSYLNVTLSKGSETISAEETGYAYAGEIRYTDTPSKPIDEWASVYETPEGAGFQKGYSYKTRVSVSLYEPYTFENTLKVASKTGTATAFELDESGTELLFWADVTLSDPPASKPLTLSVTTEKAPYGGDTISDTCNAFSMTCDAAEEDVLYEGYAICLESEDPDVPFDEWTYCWDSEKFQTGMSYAIGYTMELNGDVYNGATLLDAATLTINGKAPDFVNVSPGNNTTLQVFVIFENIPGLPEMPYGLIVGDTIVTPDNAENILGNGTAAYDASTKTLTLTDCNLTKGYEWQTLEKGYSCIFADGDLNLVVKGNNKIAANATGMSILDAIHVNGDFTLKGPGTLAVTGGKSLGTAALYCEGSATIYAEGDYSFKSNNIGAMIEGTLALHPTKVGASVGFAGTDLVAVMTESMRYYDFKITSGNELLTSLDLEKAELLFTALPNTDYRVSVGDVNVDSTNKNDIFGDGTASFDPNTKTLTLKHATINTWVNTYGFYNAVYSAKPLNVVLVGDNVIDMSAVNTPESWAACIEGDWDVTVTGDGNLTLKNTNFAREFIQNGLYAADNLTVDIGGTLTVTYGNGDEASDAYALWASNGSVTCSAKKTAISVGNMGTAELIVAAQDVSITNADDFTVSVGKTNEETALIKATFGELFIENSGTMTLTSDTATTVENSGIQCENFILLNDGTFTLNVGDCPDGAVFGIFCNDWNVVGDGAVTVTCGNAGGNGSRAVDADGTVTLTCSGTVNLQSGDGKEYSSALEADEVLIGGDAKYTFTTGDSAEGYVEGIYANHTARMGDQANVTVNAGTSGGDGVSAYGVFADDIVITDNATLKADVAGAASSAFGLDAFWSLEISTSENVSVTAGEAGEYSCGIDADIAVIGGTAKGNTISVEGQTVAFSYIPRYDASGYAVTGNLNDAATMEPIADEDTINCTKVLFTALKDAPPVPKSDDDVLVGDANGDGNVNMKDVLAARKYIAGIEVEINLDNADVNGDGSVNMKDVLVLRKYLAGLIEVL